MDSRQLCGRSCTDGESWACCMKGHGRKNLFFVASVCTNKPSAFNKITNRGPKEQSPPKLIKSHPTPFFLKDQGTNHFRSSKAVSSSVKNMFLSHIGPEGIQSVSMCTSYQSHAEISTDIVQRDVTPSTFTVRSDCSAAKANTDLTKQKKLMTFSSHQKRLVRRDHSPQMLHDCGREMS